MADPNASDNEFPLKLVLMRHAKSDWSDGSVSDHGRSLNRRGRNDSPRMAAWLADENCMPDRVLCSSAQRTRETVDGMRDTWENDLDVCYCESLYLASPESIFQTICSEGNSANCLLVVAHNPGMSQLVSAMANQSLEMPTAAAAVFNVQCDDWSELGSETPLQLVGFMRPKALN